MTPARCSVEEGGALGGAPGDGAEAAAVLAERHLEVAILERPRAVDDLDRHRRGRSGAGWPGRTAPSGSRPSTRSGVMLLRLQRAVDAQPRPQLVGLEHVVGVRVDPGAELRHASPRPSSGRRPACGRRSAGTDRRSARARRACRRPGMLRHEPCATSPSIDRTIAGLWIRVDQLRRDDADHAAVPAVAADDEHVVRADRGVGLDRLLRLRDDVRFLGCWRWRFSSFSCCASAARLVAMRFVGGEQQARRDVGRAHAAGGVDARREHEADVIAVDGLAGQAGGLEQRAQADRVRPLAQRLRARAWR